ncbi:MAG: hypothetical protein L7H10_05740 [Vulcanisaeta sp.]|nr:hypothetical protein [Vulcanisaeta sp.]MCG2870236.1 hypothetical protein [Vulcanisaeta sp.]MCG2886898.1 hypothetical protein [Vulcanisaeta sp.]
MIIELRGYVTSTQLLLWPRVIVNVRDKTTYAIVQDSSNKDDVRRLRCTRIRGLGAT